LYRKGRYAATSLKTAKIVYVLEAVKIHISDGPFFLGAVNDVPNLVVARPNLRNIPDFAFTGSWAQGAPGATDPPLYYYKT
jgi:peptide/nickel transport system substrate-binding protein